MRVPVLVLLLVVTGCKAEPPEKLVATPDKAQPAVAVVPFAPPQQVRPPQLELLPADGTVDPSAFDMKDPEHAPEPGLPPSPPQGHPSVAAWRGALAHQLPATVGALEVVAVGDGIQVKGRAETRAAVAEAMRAIELLVQTPRGLGWIVELKEGAITVRVEQLNGDILEFALGEVRRFEAAVTRVGGTPKEGEVLFELRVGPKQ